MVLPAIVFSHVSSECLVTKGSIVASLPTGACPERRGLLDWVDLLEGWGLLEEDCVESRGLLVIAELEVSSCSSLCVLVRGAFMIPPMYMCMYIYTFASIKLIHINTYICIQMCIHIHIYVYYICILYYCRWIRVTKFHWFNEYLHVHMYTYTSMHTCTAVYMYIYLIG
jgi:hypothetical protein